MSDVSIVVSLLTREFPKYLEGLGGPLQVLERDPLALSLPEWTRLLPVLLAGLGAALAPFVLFAAVLKFKTPHAGLFQWSPRFYDDGASPLAVLPYTLSFLPAILAIGGAHLGGVFTWAMFLVGYGVVPILDILIGEDSYNPTKEQEAALKQNVLFRLLTWLYVPVQIAGTTYVAWRISTANFSTFEYAGVIVSFGTAAGFGIGCVHELTHRPSIFEFTLAVISVTWTLYGHFPVEHLFGHHKRVATDEDPASSALGESVYAFMPRVLWGSFWSAWDIELRYLKKRGYSFFSIYNRILVPYIGSAILVALHYYFFGRAAAIFFVLQGFISSLTLENVNYIEHYGLRRRKLFEKDGTPLKDRDGEQSYERPGWFHAWNSGDRITNYILFKIQRHPDHHTNAGRPYQILRTYSESPTHVTGYAGSVLLSWFPPLWRWVMDPLVDKAYADRREMEAKGLNYFPAGSNNISSAFKREGEGFYAPGSSPYDSSFYGSDAAAKKVVWDESYDELEKKAVHESK